MTFLTVLETICAIGSTALMFMLFAAFCKGLAKGRRRAFTAEEDLTRRTVAVLKCGADIVRIDRKTEMNFTPFVNGVWPKPVKEGEFFIHCLNGCQEHAGCPVLKRLADPNDGHEFVGSDFLGVNKPGALNRYGRPRYDLYPASEDCKCTVCGQAFRGNDNTLCLVRLPQPPRKGNPSGNSGNDAEKTAQPSEDVAKS